MKKFQVTLFEKAETYTYTMGSRHRDRYSFSRRTGKLERSYDRTWKSKAEELKLKDLPEKYRAQFKQSNTPRFNPQKLIKEYQKVIDFLKEAELKEWELIFRTYLLNRIIINGSKERKNEFNHFSLLIKFKHPQISRVIELGEGNTTHTRFNQDGLIQRVKNIIANNQARKQLKTRKSSLILNSGNGGIIFHEILGHCLEADYVYQKLSPFSKDHLGKKILSDKITLYSRDPEDPFFKNYPFDDEGDRPVDHTIIKRGKLKSLISDYFHKNLLSLDSSGYCRVDSFTHIPGPRMFGLYLKPGSLSSEEIIGSTSSGVYAKEFGQGHMDFNKNLFFFNINEAYAIKNGEIKQPLGAISVSGQIVEVLNSIDKIGNDFRYDNGVSYCSKNGQILPVRLGQPTVKIDNIFSGRFEND